MIRPLFKKNVLFFILNKVHHVFKLHGHDRIILESIPMLSLYHTIGLYQVFHPIKSNDVSLEFVIIFQHMIMIYIILMQLVMGK